MNDQSKPVGTDQTQMAAKTSGRRRLVRGAVAFAPLVLTLRSGALAAASCTGAKTVRTTLDASGKPPAAVGAVSGDVCYKVTEVNTCPNPGVSSKLENAVGGPLPTQSVKMENAAILREVRKSPF